MKTPMQELIEFLSSPECCMDRFPNIKALEKAKELLEKEKQVIIEAKKESAQNVNKHVSLKRFDLQGFKGKGDKQFILGYETAINQITKYFNETFKN